MAAANCVIYTIALLCTLILKAKTDSEMCEEMKPLQMPKLSVKELETQYFSKFGTPKAGKDNVNSIATSNGLYMASTTQQCGITTTSASIALKNTSLSPIAKAIFPHISYVQADFKACAGVLINKEWILTSAQCISDTMDISVGRYNIRIPTEGNQYASSKKELYHGSFNALTGTGDIGLIQTDHILHLNDFVKPICVPSVWVYAETTKCFLINWGKYHQLTNDLSDDINVVPVQLLGPDECRFRWALKGIRAPKMVTCGVFFEGGPLCSGDTAGPVVCQYKAVFYVVAITGSVSGKCRPKFMPEMFTEVAPYEPWMVSNVLDDD